jgi:hypothetical protein
VLTRIEPDLTGVKPLEQGTEGGAASGETDALWAVTVPPERSELSETGAAEIRGDRSRRSGGRATGCTIRSGRACASPDQKALEP